MVPNFGYYDIDKNELGGFRSSFGGFSNKPAITQAEIGEIKAVEEPVVNLKQYQPNTRNVFHGSGPEAWHSTSYIKRREMYGPAAVRDITD